MSPQHTCMLHIDEFAQVLSGRAVSGGAEAARALSVNCACESAHSSYLEVVFS